MDSKKQSIGNLGLKYVQLLLARAGLDSFSLPDNFCCDLILSNGLMIEVKTSTIHQEKVYDRSNPDYKREYWSFKIHEKQLNEKNDYYVLVCLNEKLETESVYCVPKRFIGDRELLTIPRVFKREGSNGFSLSKFKDNFDSLFAVSRKELEEAK